MSKRTKLALQMFTGSVVVLLSIFSIVVLGFIFPIIGLGIVVITILALIFLFCYMIAGDILWMKGMR